MIEKTNNSESLENASGAYLEPSRDENSDLHERISNAVCEIFNVLYEIFTFGFRYLGSKTWSLPGVILSAPVRLWEGSEIIDHPGYHSSSIKRLTPDELRPYLKYAAAATSSFKNDEKWLNGLNLLFHNFEIDALDPAPLPGLASFKEKCIFDPESGLKIALIESSDEVIIAFGALGSGHTELESRDKQQKLDNDQHLFVIGNILGLKPGIYEQAFQIVNQLETSGYFQGKKISLAGQCLGGSLAAYVALKKELPAVCFNSAPLGAGLQQAIGSQVLSEADKYLTQITVDRDWMTNSTPAAICDWILSSIGIRTPGNFGMRYSIPTAYSSGSESHDYVMGSICKHLGYAERTFPQEIIDAENAQLDAYNAQ